MLRGESGRGGHPSGDPLEPGEPLPMRNRDIEAAHTYHEATQHNERRLLESPHYLDYDNQPQPLKIYTTLQPIPLVGERSTLEVPALEAISNSEGSAREDSREKIPDLCGLSRVLYLSAGITKQKPYPGGVISFRAHPNTGALYHIDLYLVCEDLPDLPAGVYHFGPHDFALRRLREGDHRAVLIDASGQEPALAHAPVIVVSVSTYWRNSWKYQARAYRHCFWDAGTLHANFLAVAGAEGLAPRVVIGFADRPVEHLLGLDPKKEGALTLVPLGWSEADAPSLRDVPEIHFETAPLSPTEVDYPAIRQMHAASSLESGAEAAAWRQAARDHRSPTVEGRVYSLEPLANQEAPSESIEAIIQRRGSTRAFEREASISLEQLATLLDRASSELAADFLACGSEPLIDFYLIVHAVEQLPAGAYYYQREAGSLELLREGDFRNVAGRLGLFQELPADAAANIYCLTDLDRVLKTWGNRGYRAAQLEGGIRGGRLYLAAYAQRFGATGLTFLDEEVVGFFSPHAEGKSVMFLVAVGHSASRSGLSRRT